MLVTRAATNDNFKLVYDTRKTMKKKQIAAAKAGNKAEAKRWKKAQLPYKKILNALSGAMKDATNAAYDPRNNNRRYGNPYSYLDKAISRGKLDATVRTVLKQDNEDKQWDLYCAITANPLADDVGNFEEFKQRFMSTAPKVEKTEQTEPTMNNAQIKLQVEKANKILNGFVPPLKGGG